MKGKFEIDLAAAKTLDDFFQICKKHYKTEECKLGIGAKAQLMLNINKLLAVTGVKPRNNG